MYFYRPVYRPIFSSLMTADWSWSMAETGQELQVSIIAREAASGWLQSSSYGELVIAAVISGH